MAGSYDYVKPEITVWPECKQCGMPYVYRRAYLIVWLWQPDCAKAKCRRMSTPVPVKEDIHDTDKFNWLD